MIAHATACSTGWFSIKEVSSRLGISPALMRLWESRYGWPCPRRTPSGQRRFSAGDLEEVRQVLAQIQAGRPIGSLIVAGRPDLPVAAPRAPAPLGETVLAQLPLPQRPLARALRDELVAALRRRDDCASRRIIHQALRDCAPADRAAAVWLPALAMLAAWEDAGCALAETAALRALIREQGGPGECLPAGASIGFDSGRPGRAA
jgi:DNA-binding transcriptional MerR regulator